MILRELAGIGDCVAACSGAALRVSLGLQWLLPHGLLSGGLAGCIIIVIIIIVIPLPWGCYRVSIGARSGLHSGCVAVGVVVGRRNILLFGASAGVMF